MDESPAPFHAIVIQEHTPRVEVPDQVGDAPIDWVQISAFVIAVLLFLAFGAGIVVAAVIVVIKYHMSPGKAAGTIIVAVLLFLLCFGCSIVDDCVKVCREARRVRT